MVILIDAFMASEEKGLLESGVDFLVLRACKIFVLLIFSKVFEFMPIYSIHYIFISGNSKSIFTLNEMVSA